MKSLSRVRLLATPWTAAYQAPPSMGFSRQEYWSPFKVKLVASIKTSSSYLSQSLSSFILINMPSLVPSGCSQALESNVNTPMASYVFLLKIHCLFSISLPVLSFFVSLKYFLLCWRILSFHYAYLENVTWVYHWEIRRQYDYKFCA